MAIMSNDEIQSVKSVMIVDEPGNGKMLAKELQARGFETITATNAGEARILVKTKEPAFILTELILPRETGFELCGYLKHKNDTLPVLILTEVDLDVARNLAIWAGADAYLTKPVDAATLEDTMHTIARQLADRVRDQQQQITGDIDFKCQKCHKELHVKAEHAGKLTFCSGCKSMSKVPAVSVQSGGYWRHTEQDIEEGRGEGSGGPGGGKTEFFCDECGIMLDVFKANDRGEIKCAGCGKKHRIPKWVLRQRRLFFRRPKVDENKLLTFNPARYITIPCEECHTHFRYYPDDPTPNTECPSCGHVQQSVSLKGSPLSRAALISTGRMLAFMNSKFKSKRFLVPTDREISIGTSPKCGLTLDEEGLQRRHGMLREAGGNVAAVPIEGEVYVNGKKVTNRAWLKPGDIVDFGPVQLKLVGETDLDEGHLLQKSAQEISAEEEEGFAGQTEIAGQAARILQLHWERLRESIREKAKQERVAKKAAAQQAASQQPAPAPNPPVPANGSTIEEPSSPLENDDTTDFETDAVMHD
ncbi:response regulator [Calycomorphotria hydatis]|uniref:Alkaline phosphatase synthesis transcriptional regulatory protein PhoP n=1 Tax=Calycomorphotria hydatis TaxID=2528027 RepID=A0A517TDZ4_9PLAN|nr:response regulator [Calycomorphotria hydatis]QDT66582.1 Alkaline phosphatase synthesis transcriptional regulatory protein PhoP [Calycomorphotria hydatis]